jgi:Protein of unknown function (DUF2892)
METNQTKIDRVIRILGGLFVLSLSMFGPQAVWGLLGIIPLVTGITGFDPVYGLMQYRTWPLAAKNAPR